jgi:hypothetical protein
LHAALTHLGFTDTVSLAITNEQGLDSLDEIKLFTDVEVSGICKALHRPGG